MKGSSSSNGPKQETPEQRRERRRKSMLSEKDILKRIVEEMDRVRKLEKMSKSQWAREAQIKRSFLSRLCSSQVPEVAWLTLERMARGLGSYLCSFQAEAAHQLHLEKQAQRKL